MSEISRAEFEVLNALWEKYPVTANELITNLNRNKQWHEKTVKTLLSRLVKKNAVSFEKEQRRYLYTPLLERETYTQRESQSLIERLFGGSISPFIAGFAKNKNLNKDDITELKAIINSWEQENSHKK